jgi:hypothetical protein
VASSSLMTRSEARLILRLILCVFSAVLISAAGVVLTMATGNQAIGWLLVPGGMLALVNVRLNANAGLWVYSGLIANVALWAVVVYAVGDQITERRRQRRAPAV